MKKKEKRSKTKMFVVIDSDIKKRLQKEAIDKGQSMTSLLEEILIDYYFRKTKELKKFMKKGDAG